MPFEESHSLKSRGADDAGRTTQGRWFELDAGREDHVEPKFILRLLIRRGGVEGRSIGAIRIHARTCQMEIATDAADQFQKKSAYAGPDDVHIKPIGIPTAVPFRRDAARPARQVGKPHRGRPPP